jgi:hypothetical protein
MIVVGTPTNEEPARAVTHPGHTKQIFASLFRRLEASAPPPDKQRAKP